MIKDQIAQNLKDTIKQAERYVLLTMSSALLFAALALPNPSGGSEIKWSLFDVPVFVPPWLAMIVLYFLYLGFWFMADNMMVHVRDLASKFEDKEEVRAVLSCPTILTVSPLGRFIVSVTPPALIGFALIKVYIQGIFQLPFWVFLLAFGFGIGSSLIYLRIQKFVVPYIYPER